MNLSNKLNNRKTFDSIPFLSSLSDKRWQEISQRCRMFEYDADQKIIQHGDDYSDVYFLITGSAHVLNYSSSGRAVSYATFTAGDFFGELAAIDGLPRSAWVWTMKPSKVLVMPGAVFRELVASERHLGLLLMQKLTRIIRTSDERIADMSLLGTEQRVCIELIRISQTDPNDSSKLIVFPLPTQSSFANQVGASRETVNRIFARLRDDGIIRRKGEVLYIENRKKLEDRALY